MPVSSVRRVLDLAPERGVVDHETAPPVGVIDIGSNTVRLVVYDSLSRAPFPRFNEKSLCRLGAGRGPNGELDMIAMERTVRAIERFAAIAAAMGAIHIDVLATEAIRRAPNGEAFVALIERASGLTVRVLDGSEEAYFSGLGIVSGFYRPRGLAADIGGGSVEFAHVQDDRVGDDLFSLPLGTLAVQPLLACERREARAAVDAVLSERLPRGEPPQTFFAVGGSWRSLAKVHLALHQPDLKVVHGYEVEAAAMQEFAKSVWRMSAAEIDRLPNVTARRRDTLAAAALVLDRVIKAVAPARVIFSAFGLREGWMYAKLPMEERLLDPLIESAQHFALLSARSPGFAQALVRWTDRLFPAETPAQQRLRVAICALSDIAWRDHVDVQAAQSFERLLRMPFTGITREERVFIASAVHARYGGRSDARELAPYQGFMPRPLWRRARILGSALLLAYRFAGSVPAILDSTSLEIDEVRVRLVIHGEERVPDSEAVQVRLKRLARALSVSEYEIVEAESAEIRAS